MSILYIQAFRVREKILLDGKMGRRKSIGTLIDCVACSVSGGCLPVHASY